MCMNDWRIGRLIRSVPRLAEVGPAASVTIPSNQNRVALHIGIVTEIEIVTDSLAPSNPTCIITLDGIKIFRMDVFTRNYYLTLVSHGDLPTKSFVVGPASGFMDISIIESFLPESVLQEGLKSLQSNYRPYG